LYHTLLFFLFSSFVIFSSIGVISSKNPVYSVLYLILAFINSAILFLFLDAEFLAMLLIVVYVGAVAVLFLFVVMMLNVSQEVKKSKFLIFKPLTIILGTIILVEFLYFLIIDNSTLKSLSKTKNLNLENNTVSLGNIIYTDYALLFQMCGVILFVAMIGAIVLTLRKRIGVKKQIITEQINVSKDEVIEIVKVKNRGGA